MCVEKGYALHLGIDDNEYSDIGVEIKSSSKEILNSSDLIIKVNCPLDDEIGLRKYNFDWNVRIDKIIDKELSRFL